MLRQEALKLALKEVPIYGFNNDLIERQFLTHSEIFSYENYPFSNIRELVGFYLNEEHKAFAKEVSLHLTGIDSISLKILKSLELKIENSNTAIIKPLVSYFSRGQEIILLNRKTFNLAGLIWDNAGDKSLDLNFYSKRAILSGIIILSFLHLARYEDKERCKKFAGYLVKKSKNFGEVKKLVNRLFRFSNV